MKAAFVGIFIISLAALNAEEDSQTPLGIEAVTGLRSSYIHRGFELAETTLDFQLEGEVSLSDNFFMGYGAWYATGTGKEDFTETGVKLSLTQDIEAWQWRAILNFRDTANSPLDSGLALTGEVSYFLSEGPQHSHQLTGILSYDEGAEGWYSALEFASYRALGETSYLAFELGVSAVDNFYTVDGANDLYSRLSYTYNLTKQVSISPFVAASIPLDDDTRSDLFSAGVWFEVSF